MAALSIPSPRLLAYFIRYFELPLVAPNASKITAKSLRAFHCNHYRNSVLATTIVFKKKSTLPFEV